MLVITRKLNEGILILQDGRPPITIVACGTDGSKQRIGIDADKGSVRIIREECEPCQSNH
jgi:sRNA-binding carbon storage regulator CsrA